MKLFLIGFMGSGKSLVGKMLGKQLKTEFLDLDICIEKANNTSVHQIFGTTGQDYFRQLEHEQIKNLDKQAHMIIATGGGTPCYFNNLELMNSMGKTVYLKTETNLLLERIKRDRSNRPLVKDIPPQDLETYVINQLKKREHFYSSANITIESNGKTPEKICDEIIEKTH